MRYGDTLGDTLFVGDLHGNKEIVIKALNSKQFNRIVFMGDYLDSFNRSVDDQIETISLVLNAIENTKDKEIVGLMGNHELSYFVKGNMCSGWNPELSKALVKQGIDKKALKLLQPYHWIIEGDKKWLISHAGVSNDLLEAHETSLYDYLKSGDFYQVGRVRGGNSYVGGLYWCHFSNNDYNEFVPVPNINQVVGHSHYKPNGVLQMKEGENSINYNVDCIYSDHSAYSWNTGLFLTLQDGVPKQISFDQIL